MKAMGFYFIILMHITLPYYKLLVLAVDNNLATFMHTITQADAYNI